LYYVPHQFILEACEEYCQQQAGQFTIPSRLIINTATCCSSFHVAESFKRRIRMSTLAQTIPHFQGLAAFVCKPNRLYRVYILPDELVFIWSGSGMEGVAGAQAGAAMHGALGGLIGYAIAKSLDPAKKNAARREVLNATPLDQLIDDHAKNLRAPINEFAEVRIAPRSEWHARQYSDHAHQALLHLRHRSFGKFKLGISSAEDVRVAMKELPRVLGGVCQIEIEWDEWGRRFVKRSG
jgi:hypothetical protein